MPELLEANSRLILEYPDAEIILGVVCAVGTDYSKVYSYLEEIIPKFGYRANPLKVSSFIPETAHSMRLKIDLPIEPEGKRLLGFMKAGNELRRDSRQCDLFALVAAARLASAREQFQGSPIPSPKTVHIILSLKRPEEVETLRKIYGAGFFLIGIYSTEQERLNFLMQEKNVPKDEALKLMAKDREDEDREFGQLTRDTFHLSDVFVELREARYKRELYRFLQLVFGYPYASPTPDEFAMYHAYAASLRSAQLGRQVGASILNADRNLIAVGCNEVPAAGGGLYWEGKNPDHRDHILGEDSNDKRKGEIAKDILSRLREGKVLSDSATLEGTERLLRDSLLWDITEFGRAVHAEMDALISSGRNGVSPSGGTLYATTFPCHNCTRHIIAAGLTRVVYVEPYAKSLASTLHEDAIRVEDSVAKPGGKKRKDRRVPFEPFIGVGPRRFFDLFSIMHGAGYRVERKVSGKTRNWDPSVDAKPRIPMAPSTYLQREILASQAVYSIFNSGEEETDA
jgi:deoxycytidylate deaminase